MWLSKLLRHGALLYHEPKQARQLERTTASPKSDPEVAVVLGFGLFLCLVVLGCGAPDIGLVELTGQF